MKSKLAIVFCVHHKPWLIMSTLTSVILQDFRDYDVFFLYQMGDGSCPEKPSYAEYFHLAEKYGINIQLSPYDERVRQVVRQVKFDRKVEEIELENDHGLDSGAWYKFIRTGRWKEYDHVWFIQEGTLFTRSNVISATLDFAQKESVHFLSAGHEKRKLPRDLVMKYNTRKKDSNEFDSFHDKNMRQTFEIFSRDEGFRRLYEHQWPNQLETVTQDHVPDVFDSLSRRIRQTLRSLKNGKGLPLFCEAIYENTYRRCLRDVISEYIDHHGIIFHRDNLLEWFGGSCQHFLSREFLEKFTAKIDEHNLYEVLELPFSGSALEIVWGFLPNWLGYDKWFFNGIHRVRKDFVTYKREDDVQGMCRYLNSYFRGMVHAASDGDYIQLEKVSPKYAYVRDLVGDNYGRIQ